LLWRYITPGSKVYDEAFTEELFKLRPDWAPKRYEGEKREPRRPAQRDNVDSGEFEWRGKKRVA
jgi:hypothetical protein